MALPTVEVSQIKNLTDFAKFFVNTSLSQDDYTKLGESFANFQISLVDEQNLDLTDGDVLKALFDRMSNPAAMIASFAAWCADDEKNLWMTFATQMEAAARTSYSSVDPFDSFGMGLMQAYLAKYPRLEEL